MIKRQPKFLLGMLLIGLVTADDDYADAELSNATQSSTDCYKGECYTADRAIDNDMPRTNSVTELSKGVHWWSADVNLFNDTLHQVVLRGGTWHAENITVTLYKGGKQAGTCTTSRGDSNEDNYLDCPNILVDRIKLNLAGEGYQAPGITKLNIWDIKVKRLASCVVPTISNAGIAPKTYSILSGDRIGVVCHSGYLGTFYHSPYQIENYIYCNNGRFPKLPECKPRGCSHPVVSKGSVSPLGEIRSGESYTVLCETLGNISVAGEVECNAGILGEVPACNECNGCEWSLSICLLLLIGYMWYMLA